MRRIIQAIKKKIKHIVYRLIKKKNKKTVNIEKALEIIEKNKNLAFF